MDFRIADKGTSMSQGVALFFLLTQNLGPGECLGGGVSVHVGTYMGALIYEHIQYKTGSQWRKDGGTRKRDSKYQNKRGPVNMPHRILKF